MRAFVVLVVLVVAVLVGVGLLAPESSLAYPLATPILACDFNSSTISGQVQFAQSSISLNLWGLQPGVAYPWHIHLWSIYGTCSSAGGHFNTAATPMLGELAAKWGALNSTNSSITWDITDPDIHVNNEDDSIVGRSMVVHSPTGARLACCTIRVVTTSPNYPVVNPIGALKADGTVARCDFWNSTELSGYILITQLINGDDVSNQHNQPYAIGSNISFSTVVRNTSFSMPASNWYLTEYAGVGVDQGDCSAQQTGGVFASHDRLDSGQGTLNPASGSATFQTGQLSNKWGQLKLYSTQGVQIGSGGVQTVYDASIRLVGPENVIGRSIYVATAAGGQRLACCRIRLQQQPAGGPSGYSRTPLARQAACVFGQTNAQGVQGALNFQSPPVSNSQGRGSWLWTNGLQLPASSGGQAWAIITRQSYAGMSPSDITNALSYGSSLLFEENDGTGPSPSVGLLASAPLLNAFGQPQYKLPYLSLKYGQNITAGTAWSVNDGQLQLQGPYSLLGRSVVLFHPDDLTQVLDSCTIGLVPTDSWPVDSQPLTASCRFPPGLPISGSLTITQASSVLFGSTLQFALAATNVDLGAKPYRIHLLGVPDPAHPDCSLTGATFAPGCVQGWNCTNATGELSNKHGLFSGNQLTVSYSDSDVQLSGPNSVLGRSLVIESSSGSGAALACCTIERRGSDFLPAAPRLQYVPGVEARCQLSAPSSLIHSGSLGGWFELRQMYPMDTQEPLAGVEISYTIWGSLAQNLSSSLNSTASGGLPWHIHQQPTLSSDSCAAAQTGAHYLPLDLLSYNGTNGVFGVGELANLHGNLVPNNSISTTVITRTFYDAHVQLLGSTAVAGLSMVVHNSSGTRLACCDITPSSFTSPGPSPPVLPQLHAGCLLNGPDVYGAIALDQPATPGQTGTQFTVSTVLFRQPAEWQLAHPWHIHQYGVDWSQSLSPCAVSSTGAHYAPNDNFGPEPGYGLSFGGVARIEIGDLSDKHGGPLYHNQSQFSFVDPQVHLSGPFSVVGRALVVHSGANRIGCCTIFLADSNFTQNSAIIPPDLFSNSQSSTSGGAPNNSGGNGLDSSGSGNPNSLSGGVIAAIVLAVLLFLTFLLFVAYVIRKRRQQRSAGYLAASVTMTAVSTHVSNSQTASPAGSPSMGRNSGVAQPTTAGAPPGMFPVGTKVQAKYSQDGIFYRAVVKGHEDGQYLVTYVDFNGAEERLPPASVKR